MSPEQQAQYRPKSDLKKHKDLDHPEKTKKHLKELGKHMKNLKKINPSKQSIIVNDGYDPQEYDYTKLNWQ